MSFHHIVVKKYPNRRLYNTDSSSYITLEDIAQLIKKDYNVEIIDAKTGENLTKLTLAQIFLEQNQSGYGLLPVDLLKFLIKLQDSNMGKVFNDYITLSMEYFIKHYAYIEHLVKNSDAQSYMWNYFNQNLYKINQHNINFMQMAMSAISLFDTKNHL